MTGERKITMTYTIEELENMKDEYGSLYLRGTQITALPENLTVGGSLNLGDTPITALPENLTVGGNLDLSGTQITALPENLTVGGNLYLSGTQIKNKKHYKRLRDGDCVPDRYIYADGILTHIKRIKKIGDYTFYIGEIKGNNVLTDGKLFAHCATIAEGIDDIAFKSAEDRGAEQYKSLTLDSVLPRAEAVTMYRIITGACKAGTNRFLESLKEIKEAYTVREMIDLTKRQYGGRAFEKFFTE